MQRQEGISLVRIFKANFSSYYFFKNVFLVYLLSLYLLSEQKDAAAAALEA